MLLSSLYTVWTLRSQVGHSKHCMVASAFFNTLKSVIWMPLKSIPAHSVFVSMFKAEAFMHLALTNISNIYSKNMNYNKTGYTSASGTKRWSRPKLSALGWPTSVMSCCSELLILQQSHGFWHRRYIFKFDP